MSNPLYEEDPLRVKANDADGRAKLAWAAFEEARTKAIQEGKLNTKGDPGAELVGELKALHEAYEAAATEAETAQRTYVAELESARGGTKHRVPGQMPSLGAEFVKRMLEQGNGSAKAFDATSGSTAAPRFFDPLIRELPARQLFVRSLIPVRTTDSDNVQYVRQTVMTNNAAPVATGAVKPTSVITVERVEELVRTIAHVSEGIDRAILMDFDALAAFIDNQLRLGVLLAEENQIINGNGTPPNLRGILNTVGIQTQALGGDTRPDAIYKAITKLRLAFFAATAIVLHPTDWQSVRLLKDTNGLYVTSSVTAEDAETLHGLPVVTSPVIAQGTGLVGDFTKSFVADREQARVSFTESGISDTADTDLFSRNQLRFRGESRIGFGVERPTAFCTVTGL